MKSTFLFTVTPLFLNGCSTIFFPWKNMKKSNRAKWEWVEADGNCKYKNVKVVLKVRFKIIMGQNWTLRMP